MSRTIMLISAEPGIGLTSVSLGVIRAMERKGVRLSMYKPISHFRDGHVVPARTTGMRAFATGLPIFMVNTNTWQTSLSLQSFSLGVPVDDHERIDKVQEYVTGYINADWTESLTVTSGLPSPADRANALFCRKATNHEFLKRLLSVQSAALRSVCCWVTRMRSPVWRRLRALNWAQASKSLTLKWFRHNTNPRMAFTNDELR